MATFGGFPGVQVTTQSGGISSVAVGNEEKLVIFGEANYDDNNDVDGTASAESVEQINAPQVADDKFGEGSELADALKEALANGANIDFLYGVAVNRVAVTGETQSSQGTSDSSALDNYEIVERADVDASLTSSDDDNPALTWDDDGDELAVEFRYDGAPSTPSDNSTVYVNPLTGQYAAGKSPAAAEFTVDYDYYDYTSAVQLREAQNVVNEDETGIWAVMSDSDSLSSDLDTAVSSMRDDYQMVNAIQLAEPNDNELLSDTNTTVDNGGAHAQFDTSTYDTANNSINQEYFYKFAPSRLDGSEKTIGGGIAGLFAGNDISNPIYNDQVSGYSSLQQQFSRSEAGDMRDENVIPVRSGGSVRVKGNVSTAGTGGVAGDFFSRRIADRVILIGKQVGDAIIGRINDEDTRADAEAALRAEMRSLAASGLIKGNAADEQNWNVTVYEDENDDTQVNIDIEFTPYGIVKRVNETVTIDT